MPRLFVAFLVAGLIGAESLDARAEAVVAPAKPAEIASPSTRAPAPLAAGGAAGIRRAQGASDRGILIASGAILSAIVAALLLIEEDDEDTTTTTTTGTN